MTNNQGKISLLQQARFYLNQPANIDVYIAFVGRRRAGYLLLRQVNKTHMITEAVASSFRRKGLGARLIEFAQTRADHLTADILATNVASVRLHEGCGFECVGRDRGLLTYVWQSSAGGPVSLR